MGFETHHGRQVSNEGTVLGSALLFVRGNDAITSHKRGKTVAHLRVERASQVACVLLTELDLAPLRALLCSVSSN